MGQNKIPINRDSIIIHLTHVDYIIIVESTQFSNPHKS